VLCCVWRNKIDLLYNWFLYGTEEGGIFNPEQPEIFDVVIFGNRTGRLLNDAQQKALKALSRKRRQLDRDTMRR
jgi:hypothetical protein